jgi:hypothetical protein
MEQTPEQALAYWERELKQAEAALTEAAKKRDSLRQVVLGLRHYVEAGGRTREPSLFELPAVKSNGSGAASAAPIATPRGRQAVRLIVEEADRPLSIHEIVQGAKDRGWMVGVDSLRNALGAAANRLVRDGEIVRTRPGVYAKLPDADGGGARD